MQLFGGIKEIKADKVVSIKTDTIAPNPHQPRRYFDENELLGLACSIKQNGILQPLSVRRCGEGYELISGERRLRAAITVGMTTVPCIVVDITERNSALFAIIENIQRENLSFFEEAAAIERLISYYGMTQEDAAVRLGKAQSTIANKLRLLKLTDTQMRLIEEAGLTERHARAILRLPQERRDEVLGKVVMNGLNVEKTEYLIDVIMRDEEWRSSIRRRKGAFRDIRLFINTINKAVETMKAAGIDADSEKKQYDGYIEYIVRIPQNREEAHTT